MLSLNSFERLSKHGTPFYYYDIPLLRRTLDFLAEQSGRYGIKVHYAVKANSERRILKMISEAGFGVDAVSANEILHAIDCGFAPSDVMFAGVGKTDHEIRTALQAGTGCFNVESLCEMDAIECIAAEMGVTAPVAFRINPNIDPHTHRYITTGLEDNKFGISSYEFDQAAAKVKECSHLRLTGLQFHVGSQITDVENVFALESRCAREITDYFESLGLKFDHIDFGGGLGVDYDEPEDHPVADFETWFKAIRKYFPEDCGYELHVEPGRALVAQCASLITSVVFVKETRTKTFIITDAGMNDLIRPALYGAYHKVENLSAYYQRGDEDSSFGYDIVGPICESSDTWGEGRLLQKSFRGDLLAIRTAGAYGQTMASRYNLRDLAPAVYSDEL